MAGNEDEDWTDSPAERVTNEPTETSYSSLPGSEDGNSCTDDQSGIAEAERPEGMPNMGLYKNDDVPGAIGGVLCDENHDHKSGMVQEAQQF
ncbi:Hypothetical predicted protein [Paramuricea clavata]|uniref:Uncharacterized protein n=1 Tax=Paramuricea clavata TaxID=317549 RepID=A0A6S7H0B0_PARCT|nr:Hypothetical predicted protein [Paramuricea clavata]